MFSQTITHEVQRSETLYSLSRRYGVTVEEIRAANNMGTSNDLFVGQKLTIPGQQTQSTATTNTSYDTYTVIAGDTLYSISRKNDITVDELRSLNELTPESVLKIGQTLKIPATITEVATVPSIASELIGTHEDPRVVSNRKGDTSLVWPIKAVEVEYVTGKISGVALTGSQNENVNAIRSGTVMFSGVYRGFGQVVFIQDTTDHIYVYTGLSSLSVNKGEYIQYGQTLGTIGNDTLSGTNRMNFMVFKSGNPIDPANAPRG
ncbi:MAG: M23 family metallopeptidase [Spirochaetales bacterium]